MSDEQAVRELECPTPMKARYATMEVANMEARRASFALGKNLYPYDTCPCGWIHLTSKPRRGAHRDSRLTGADGYDNDTFRLVVRDDVLSLASEEDAAVLRRVENAQRWKAELKVFQIDMETQFAQRAGDLSVETKAWRTRAARIRRAIADRREEAKVLAQELHLDVRTSMVIARSVAGALNESELKTARRAAGERAVKRLKDAHSDEFKDYLIEEFEAAGLPLMKGLTDRIEERSVVPSQGGEAAMEGESSE